MPPAARCQLPELIALPVTQGLPDYLDWVAASVTMTASPAPDAS
ncbi:MAG: divalent-cation tolerance protein CutA [Azoarcus sp.]|nr:divalent-cation tolerance protein CutA [Azoarcus sp.]